jgi:hypothetical protein
LDQRFLGIGLGNSSFGYYHKIDYIGSIYDTCGACS